MSFEMVSRLITNLEKKPMLEDALDSMLSPGLTKKSSKEEVSMWLEVEGFLLARDKLRGITGKELYGMPKEDLRKMLGFAEAARLFSKLLKEKELLPAAEKTIKESDFERFMRIRREDVDSRIPNNPITTFSAPAVPPKPTRPMIREVFYEPDEPVRGKYAEKVKKSKDKSSEKRFSKRVESVPSKEVSRKKEKHSKYRKESPESEVSELENEKRRHKHKKDKKERKEREEGKERKEREEGRGKKDRHKRSHKSKQSSESDASDSESDESVDTHPKSSRHRRRERDRKKNQEKEKKKEPEPTASPPPAQPYLTDPLRPQISPYAPMSPVSPMLTPHLHPQYPPPFPDPYTNQLMMQQAQIVRAEQDKFAAEMRLRHLKSGFGAPGALSFPPPMPYHNF